MSERELNKKWLKGQLKDFTYSEELIDKILDLLSEQYKKGLHQGWFDREMDMIQLQNENKELKEQCEIVEKRLVDEYNDMLDKRNILFVENCKLKRKLECSQTNEETYRLEMLDITKMLGLNEDTLFDDVKKYASKLQHIIDELEKWLEDEIKHYKEHFEFVCKNNSLVPSDDTRIILEKDDLIIQKLEKTLNKLQELKGSEKE